MKKDKADMIELGLIDELNLAFKKAGTNASANFILNSSSSVKEWVSTGSLPLDIILSNRPDGGLPVGRLTEISGVEGAGKTLLASRILANTQKSGGIGVYIDTEHAGSAEVFVANGVDVNKLIHVQCGTVEDVFQTIDRIINKIRSSEKDKLVTIVWDSVAGTSTAAEIEGTMSDHTMAAQARTIGKGLRKYMQVISEQRICLVFINQLRTKLGITFGDQKVTPGGKAIPFFASVRLRLMTKKTLKDGDLMAGQVVEVVVKKNKVAANTRNSLLYLRWGGKLGAWVDEAETTFAALQKYGVVKNVTNQTYKLVGSDVEFTKRKFATLFNDPEFKALVHEKLSSELIITEDSLTNELVEQETSGDEE